jgi:hypothetical protein
MDDLINQGFMGQAARENNIYLGGMPITGDNTCSTWRETFIDICNSLVEDRSTFRYLNPCKGMYEPVTGLFKKEAANAWRYSDELIVDKRVHSMLNSSILVFNFADPLEDILMAAYECGFGFTLKTTYVITIGQPPNPMVKLSSSFIAKDLYEAASYCLYIDSKNKDL